MNVNDLHCVGTTPISMVDYLAIESLNPDMIAAIAEAWAKGQRKRIVQLLAGEIRPQLHDIIKGGDARAWI